MRADHLLPDLEKLHRESFTWCLVCCRGDRDEAEEVLQTSYLKVLDGRARHPGEGDFKPWIFAVIRRTAAGRRRRAALSRLRFLPGFPRLELVSADRDPESRALRSEQARRVRRALSTLSLRQRQALELAFYHGLSLRQAAAVMGITLGAVRSHYHRGKQRLSAELRKGGEACPETKIES